MRRASCGQVTMSGQFPELTGLTDRLGNGPYITYFRIIKGNTRNVFHRGFGNACPYFHGFEKNHTILIEFQDKNN